MGFIGRTLTEVLQQNKNIDLYGIDIKYTPLERSDLPIRLVGGANQRGGHLMARRLVRGETRQPLYLNSLNFSVLDVRNQELLAAYLAEHQFDGIIHLAAISRVKDAENDKENCINTNYYGTKFLTEAVAQSKTWVIFGSSREVYGEQKQFPVAENADKVPLNVYGFYKLEGERLVTKHIKNHIILRFSNVYGNAYDIQDRVIPNFMNKIMHNHPITIEGGEQIIDFTHISDTVKAIVKSIDLLSKNENTQEQLHVSPGHKNEIKELAMLIGEVLNRKVNIQYTPKRNYDVVQFIGDSSKRKKVLGLNTFLSLKKGIQKMAIELGLSK